MSAQSKEEVQRVVEVITRELGERLVAVYRFGSDFARGPRAAKGRLLVLVDRIDHALLELACSVAQEAERQNVRLRLDTVTDLERSTDVFPIFALELINTRELLGGRDVLTSLKVRSKHLRLQLEHSLRALHRDLLKAYIKLVEPHTRARALREHARKAVYLLEGVLILHDADVPAPARPAALIEAAGATFLSPEEKAVWERLRRFAGYEEALENDDLRALHAQIIGSLHVLIDHIDRFED